MDAAFAGTREGQLLRDVAGAFEAVDEDVFTEKVRENSMRMLPFLSCPRRR